jgi:hypothetical protein
MRSHATTRSSSPKTAILIGRHSLGRCQRTFSRPSTRQGIPPAATRVSLWAGETAQSPRHQRPRPCQVSSATDGDTPFLSSPSCSACLAHSEVDLSLDCPHYLFLTLPVMDQGQIRMQRSVSGSRVPGMVPVSANTHPCTCIDCTEPYPPRTRRRRVMAVSLDGLPVGSSLGGFVLQRGGVTHEPPESSEGLLATMSEGASRLRLRAASATFRYQPGSNCRQAFSRQFRPAIQLVF